MILQQQLDFLQKERKVYIYIYEWIDDLTFVRCANYFNDVIRDSLIEAGWDTTGKLQEIWIPPFAIGALLDEPVEFGFDLTKAWKSGMILWHVKQQTDGLSFIISLKKLNLPDFGLE